MNIRLQTVEVNSNFASYQEAKRCKESKILDQTSLAKRDIAPKYSNGDAKNVRTNEQTNLTDIIIPCNIYTPWFYSFSRASLNYRSRYESHTGAVLLATFAVPHRCWGTRCFW